MIIYILLLSILSAICYRISGHGGFKGAKLIRRLGCPLIILITFWLLKGFNIYNYGWYILTYILSYLALSTYNDWLAPDGTSENWLCWCATGAFYGLSSFPLVFYGVSWFSIILRSIVLAGLVTLISEKSDNVFVEEFGRGLILILTLPILLI